MHRFVQHGLSMFTWGDDPTPYEQAFEAIKAGIDSLPPGVKMFLNSGIRGSIGYIQEPKNNELMATFGIYILQRSSTRKTSARPTSISSPLFLKSIPITRIKRSYL